MARKLKIKIPKRVAGMKIPKSVRKGPVRDFLNSSAGQLLVAEALVAVSGVLIARRSDGDSRFAEFMQHPLESLRTQGSMRARQVRATVSDESRALSHAFSEALRAFRGAMDEAHESGRQTAPENMSQDAGEVMSGDLQTEPERAKKKPAGSRSETPSTPH